MGNKKRNIYIIAMMFALFDLLIGYLLTRLWFFIFQSNQIAGILFLLTWCLAGYHAVNQYFWAKKKIGELK